MSEWKLFDDGNPPAWLDPSHLRGYQWMDLAHQPGFEQRAKMVTDMLVHVKETWPDVKTVTDLGCGDGEMLSRWWGMESLRGLTMNGYEAGSGDVAHARGRGLPVQQADILDVDSLLLGRVVVVSEVLEHLADPVAFLEKLHAYDRGGVQFLIASSPSGETDRWFNEIHAWAWDTVGYDSMIRRAGWRPVTQWECGGGMNTLQGVAGPQWFQCILAFR